MYQLHIANKNYSSWSLRPWLIMRQLNIAFEEVMLALGTVVPGKAIKDFSPSGKVPCLRDDSLVVWDSLAITEYLAEGHRGVWPTEVKSRAWARSAAAEMHSGFNALRSQCTMNVGVRVRLHHTNEELAADLRRLDLLWQEGLSSFGGDYLAGPSFTAVDAFFAPVAFRLQTYGLELSERSMRYAKLLLMLPGMREWEGAALQETLRHEKYEEISRERGIILQDLRCSKA